MPKYFQIGGNIADRENRDKAPGMKLVVATEDDQIVNVEVDPGTEVENFKAILQAETDVPTGDQILMAGGKVVQSGTLSGNGLGDNDVVMLIKKQAAGASAGAGASGGNPLAVNPSDGSAVNPGEYIRFLKGDAAQLSQIAQVLPELHSAVMRDDHAEFQRIMRALHQKKMEQEARRKAEIDLLNADPFDMEAQRKIQEMIDQSNVNENYEMAMENTPEAFGSVIMLYVDMEVNGHPLKAFVDSGAQMTIMSLGCAQRLGLERLIDKRWQGVAKGVGTQKIIGRVHQAPIKVADKHLACAITVLEKEQDMDFLLGLDMLKRHQCCIDLEKNALASAPRMCRCPSSARLTSPRMRGPRTSRSSRPPLLLPVRVPVRVPPPRRLEETTRRLPSSWSSGSRRSSASRRCPRRAVTRSTPRPSCSAGDFDDDFDDATRKQSVYLLIKVRRHRSVGGFVSPLGTPTFTRPPSAPPSGGRRRRSLRMAGQTPAR